MTSAADPLARGRRYACATLVALVVSTSFVAAQAPQTQAVIPPADTAYARVPLTTGRSTVVTTSFDITRIAVTNPAIADATVVATGGLSGLIGPLSTAISHVEPWLTLHGLRIIFEKNQERA